MKKTRVILLAVAMLLLVSACGGKENKKSVSITGGAVKSGEEITVYLRAEGKLPVAAYGFNLYYDTEELSFVECGTTPGFKKAWSGVELSNETESSDGKHVIVIAGVNQKEEEQFYEGDMYYITFKALGKAGTQTKVTLATSALEDLDGNEHLKEFTMENGTIEIK